MITVKATREGLIGQKTAAGVVIDARMPFVALPAVSALYRFVRLRNPANGRTTIAIVLDVGPWNEHDDPYVFGRARPAAERGLDTRGRPTNGAGIDLSEYTWRALDMRDNGSIEWEFVEEWRPTRYRVHLANLEAEIDIEPIHDLEPAPAPPPAPPREPARELEPREPRNT
jgi:hypothetical protein